MVPKGEQPGKCRDKKGRRREDKKKKSQSQRKHAKNHEKEDEQQPSPTKKKKKWKRASTFTRSRLTVEGGVGPVVQKDLQMPKKRQKKHPQSE